MKINFKSSKGITGIDISVAVIVIVIFTGMIASLMYSNYKTAIEIQKSAQADAYATIILEKVDEKPYEDITDNFISDIIKDEIDIDYTNYQLLMSVEEVEENLIKKVNLTLKYDFEGKTKQLVITKLKIKEIGV